MFTKATPGGVVAVRAVTERAERARLSRKPWFKTVLVCLALSACDQSSTGPQTPAGLDPAVLADAEVQILSGNDQEAVVGSTLAEPLSVVVLDVNGNAIAGAPVTWTFGSGKGAGRGNASRASVVTVTADDQGRAEVEWELGTTAGAQLAWAEVGTTSTVTEADATAALAPPADRGNQTRGKKVGFWATSSPSEPAEIIVSQTSLELAVGETVMLTAMVVDKWGNEIPDAVVEWTSSDPSIVSVESPTAAPSLSFAALPKALMGVETSRDEGAE